MCSCTFSGTITIDTPQAQSLIQEREPHSKHGSNELDDAFVAAEGQDLGLLLKAGLQARICGGNHLHRNLVNAAQHCLEHLVIDCQMCSYAKAKEPVAEPYAMSLTHRSKPVQSGDRRASDDQNAVACKQHALRESTDLAKGALPQQPLAAIWATADGNVGGLELPAPHR